MINQTPFNQAAFNVPFDDTLIYLQTDAYETIGGFFGLAVIAVLDTNANESITGQIAINAGVLLQSQSIENVSAVCEIIGTVNLNANAAETIDKNLVLGAMAYVTNNAGETIQASAILGAEYYLSGMAQEQIECTAYCGCIVYMPGQNTYEIITAALDIEAQDIVEIVIDITLKPGQSLIIDSENYVVMLDGENIISKHSGGWCWLDRLVRSVHIDTGTTASLQSSMLYTERWL